MTVTRKQIDAAAKQTTERARRAGQESAQRIAVRLDTALARVGKAAKGRLRKRAIKRVLKVAGKAAVATGIAAVTVVAGRAVLRKARQKGGRA